MSIHIKLLKNLISLMKAIVTLFESKIFSLLILSQGKFSPNQLGLCCRASGVFLFRSPLSLFFGQKMFNKRVVILPLLHTCWEALWFVLVFILLFKLCTGLFEITICFLIGVIDEISLIFKSVLTFEFWMNGFNKHWLLPYHTIPLHKELVSLHKSRFSEETLKV
jgi:hypothetical protein